MVGMPRPNKHEDPRPVFSAAAAIVPPVLRCYLRSRAMATYDCSGGRKKLTFWSLVDSPGPGAHLVSVVLFCCPL